MYCRPHESEAAVELEIASKEDNDSGEIDSVQEDAQSERSVICGQKEHHSVKLQWSDEDVDRLKVLKSAGVSDDDIARLLYRSSEAIETKWSDIAKFSVRAQSQQIWFVIIISRIM